MSATDTWAHLILAVTWQLAALAVVALVAELLARRPAPRLRYWLWGFVLVAPLLLAPGRLALQRRDAVVHVAVLPAPAPPPAVTPAAPAVSVPPPGHRLMVHSAPPPAPRPAPPMDWTRPLAAAWLLGTLWFLARLVAGCVQARRLWRTAVPVEDAAATPDLAGLIAAAGLSGTVAVRASSELKGPVVCGFWRPAIIVPARWLRDLPEGDLHALLAHEVAHVLRRDTRANLVQRLVGAFLFFHPAAWLASRRLTLAREEICDAWAVTHGADPRCYVRALAAAALHVQFRHAGALVGVAENRSTLRRRVEAVLRGPSWPRASRLLVVATTSVMVAAAVACGVTAPGARPAGYRTRRAAISLPGRQRSYVIWPRPAASSLPELYATLIYGMAAGMRFRAPADAAALRGGLYFTLVDPEPPREDLAPHKIRISVCATSTGALEDIVRTRLASALVIVPARKRTRAVRRLPFALDCRLKQGRYYWLVVEPGWTEPSPYYTPTRYVDFVRRETRPEEAVVRISVTHQFDGGKVGDRPGVGLLADLEAVSTGTIPDPALASHRTVKLGARTITFKEPRNWQVTYIEHTTPQKYANPEEAELFPVTVSYVAPDRTKVDAKGTKGFVAVSDARSVRVLFPKRGYGMWIPGQYAPQLSSALELKLGGPGGPVATDWRRIEYVFAHGTEPGPLQGVVPRGARLISRYTILPDETVAGRRCLVLRNVFDLPGTAPTASTTEWFDREYGIPLRMKTVGSGWQTETTATSVKIDTSLRTREFSLAFPPGLPVFKGRLDLVDADTYLAGAVEHPPVSGASSPAIEYSAGPVQTEVLQPTWLASGFFPSTGAEGAFATSPQPYWMEKGYWFSKTGGVINFTQGTKEWYDQPELPGETRTITLRGHEARVLIYHQPFDGTVIRWQEDGRYYRLEGTGATTADLEKMAETMRVEVIPPQPSEDGG